MLRHLLLISTLLLAAASVGGAGQIKGAVYPFCETTEISLWYQDSTNHCSCDSYIGGIPVDSAGKFVIGDLRSGRYTLDVKPGGIRYLARTIDLVKVGDGVTNVGLIKLSPSAWVTGKVSPPGRHLGVWKDPNSEGTCIAKEDGTFELCGLSVGKHRLRVSQDYCKAAYVEVDIRSVREYRIPPVTLTSAYVDFAEVRGKLIADGLPTTLEAMHTGQFALGLYALPAADGVPARMTDRTMCEDIDPATGCYSIRRLRPGRYDLLAYGPSCIVRGISDLPASSPEHEKAVSEEVRLLALAIADMDEQSLRSNVAADCRFRLTGNSKATTQSVIDGWPSRRHVLRGTEVLFVRASPTSAVVFTKSGAVSAQTGEDDGLEMIESWRLTCELGKWKLADYRQDAEMTEALSHIRYCATADHSAKRRNADLPPVAIVFSQDPRICGLKIDAGQSSANCDFDLRVR